MVLSKPLYSFLGFYFSELHNHPLRTKAVSSCIIATLGNIASHYVSGTKRFSRNSLTAYCLYGLIFGGTFPHYFYMLLESLISEDVPGSIIIKLLIERLIYAPLYNAFTLYMISRLEGKDHKAALKQLETLYWSVIRSNWKYLTLIQYINLNYVPPMLRVLIVNLVGFFWTIYIANKRRQQQAKDR